MAQFCTVSEFLTCYDNRRVAELASDTGEPAPSVGANANLLAMLDQGEQDFLQAARQSDRYTVVMIGQIYASATKRWGLISIIAAFAFTRLVARRGMAEDELKGLSPLYENALETREAFLSGQLILDDPSGLVAAAGVTVEVVTPNPQLCSWVTGNRLFGAGCGCGNWNGAWNRYGCC